MKLAAGSSMGACHLMPAYLGISLLSQTEQNSAAKQGAISLFLRWWGRELQAMLPSRLALLLGLTNEIIIVAPEADGFSIQLLLGDKSQALGPVSKAGLNDRLAVLRDGGAECVLRIPASHGLRRQAPIAVSALPRGFDAIAGEIERQTPFAPDQVYAGYRVEETVDVRGRVMAHLALAPCGLVDEMLQRLAIAGLTPDRVCLADDTGGSQAGDTLHILSHRSTQAPPKILLVAAGLLLMAALVSPFIHDAFVLREMQHRLAAARQAAQARTQQHPGASSPSAQLSLLSDLRSRRSSVTGLVNMISIALPDTAHLAQFELAGNALSIQGVTQSASDLIAPLEALPVIHKVEFSAPTLRDPVTGLEQFQLTLALTGRPVRSAP